MIRVFGNGPEGRDSITGRVMANTKKNGTWSPLCSTQHYKIGIKGKVEQCREKNCALPLQFVVVAIEKGAFGSPLTTVVNLTNIYMYVCGKGMNPIILPPAMGK